jgi:hypothetical protein
MKFNVSIYGVGLENVISSSSLMKPFPPSAGAPDFRRLQIVGTYSYPTDGVDEIDRGTNRNDAYDTIRFSVPNTEANRKRYVVGATLAIVID